MNRQHLPIDRRQTKAAKVAVFGAAVIGYSVLGGLTRPFTPTADAVTAVPLAVVAVAAAVQIRRRPLSSGAPSAQPIRRVVPWIVIVAAITGWELYCFGSNPRSAYPTLSSLLDQLDSTHLGRSAVFVLWLLLGTYLVMS